MNDKMESEMMNDKVWEEIDKYTRGRPSQRSVLFAELAQSALARAFIRSSATGKWFIRETASQATVEKANAILEFYNRKGIIELIYGSGRTILQRR